MTIQTPPRLSDSRRFQLRTADLREIERTLDATGHVVLEDLWSVNYLSRLGALATSAFGRLDQVHQEGKATDPSVPATQVETYLGGFTNLDALADTSSPSGLEEARRLDEEFFDEVERTGLPGLFRHLLHGDFMVGVSERVIRRVDPRFPLRFVGLHMDGQLHLCSSRGLRSQRELTVWTPLTNCMDEDTPRLLLLQRGEDYESRFLEVDKTKDESIAYYPMIQLRPQAIRDESAKLELMKHVHQVFDRLFEGSRCYAPPVPLGSAVLFDRDIFHGSYYRPGMTVPRFSLDFRAVPEYAVDERNRAYTGKLFTRPVYPCGTPAALTAPPSSTATIDQIGTRHLARHLLRRVIPAWMRPRRGWAKIASRLAGRS